MIQLTYQPALDPHHTVFRFLRLREAKIISTPLQRDHFRILDYYLLFPFRSNLIRMTKAHQSFKKVAKSYLISKPYGELPDDRVMFDRMWPIQSVALDTLATLGFLDQNSHQRGLAVASDLDIPSVIGVRVLAENSGQADLIEFLKVLGSEYTLLGEDGLKHRSGLMEHRYDAP